MTARYGALFGILAFVALPAGASETGHHWSYSGDTGPSHWSQLEPDYAVCGTGKTQSPVNIETAHVQQQELPPLIFNYHPSTMRIVDNGHTVQVSVPPGDTLTVGDHRYTLVQFHFQHPS